MTEPVSRRTFIKTAAAATAVTIVPRHVFGGPRNIPPSEKMNIAGIGIGGMGAGNLGQPAGENIVALCDVDPGYAGQTIQAISARRRSTRTSAACWTSRKTSTAW